jgi:ADP-ribosyl-[dinitrogen reductase] hydrolase
VGNACRVHYDRETLFVTQPRENREEGETMDNPELLDWLFASGGIDLCRGELFARYPPPLPTALDWDRVDGMLLGLAIGDALGNTTESLLPERRRELYGEIRDYVPHRRHNTLATPTDDTQLAFWTLDQMLADDGFIPEHVAKRFASERIFGIGHAVAQATSELRSGELPWYECGSPSAGNGALMRIAPMLVPFVRSPSPDLWADTVLSAIVTHSDAASTSACVAFVAMLWQLLGMDEPPEPSWWRRTYVATARDLEGETRHTPRGGAFVGYDGPLWQFVDERLGAAEAEDLSVRTACEQWWSGAYLLETVPCALYILARHAGDPEEALVRAVNDTKDNDTIAAIVGAAVGALHGAAALPERWVSGLSGRTRADDDGEVQRIMARARERWDSAGLEDPGVT